MLIARVLGVAATVDHGAWSRFLATYVVPGTDGVNRVAYRRVSTADRATLDGYVKALEAVDVDRLAGAEQMAFWINLYNALTVRVVLDHPKVESIRDIKLSSGFFSAGGPWDHPLAEVKGEALTLNDIEHPILRPIWRDPRVHYAVNCASIGCPNLARKAYGAKTLDADLEAAARAYVTDPRGLRLRPDGGFTASKIYAWFADDFGGDDGLRAHLLRYTIDQTRARLEAGGEIDAWEYDWSLNAAPMPAD